MGNPPTPRPTSTVRRLPLRLPSAVCRTENGKRWTWRQTGNG